MPISTRATTALPADNLGHIVVDALPQDLVRDLGDAGVSEEDLRAIAGRDGVIRGEDELNNLFSRIDEPRVSAPYGRSIFDALREQIDFNRRRAGAAGARRFSADDRLMDVLDGGASIGPGAPPASVFRIEQALADVGLLAPDHVDGLFADSTVRAVELLQMETDLALTGRIDAATLAALSTVVPAPGARLVRTPEYDRMREDLRLTVVLGAHDRSFARARAELEFVAGLVERGFVPNQDQRSMHVQQWTNDATTLSLIMPFSEASFFAAERQTDRADVVLWSGRRLSLGEQARRSRTGLRPGARHRPASYAPTYQLVCATGCAPDLAAQERVLGRNVDTDLLTTSAPAQARASHTLHFLDVVMTRGTTDDLRDGLDQTAERGFLHNRTNTTEPT